MNKLYQQCIYHGEKAFSPFPFCTPDILYQNKFDSEYQV